MTIEKVLDDNYFKQVIKEAVIESLDDETTNSIGTALSDVKVEVISGQVKLDKKIDML